MNKKIKIIIVLLVVAIISIVFMLFFFKNNDEIKTIKSEKELLNIYNEDDFAANDMIMNILTMPFSFLEKGFYLGNNYICDDDIHYDTNTEVLKKQRTGLDPADFTGSSESTTKISDFKGSSKKDYSTTNIQVENVDEADITKTDGDYIYSISDSNVIITDVRNPEKVEISSTIRSNDGSIPEDLILYKNELVVISEEGNTSRYYKNNSNTIVKIYDITNKSKPILIKSYELYEPYYTSRCINNVLYVVSSGSLRKENDKIVRAYKEDKKEQEIELDNIKYLRDLKTDNQTLISVVDLDNAREDIKVSSYLMDISNAYVSENSIYLLDEIYDYNKEQIPFHKLFGLKGVIGLFSYDYNDYIDDYSDGYYTQIYKFDINKEGLVSYSNKNKIKGKTINQYSLDEQKGHLRMALYDSDGARVAIFDDKLNQLGISDYVAKGEKMYSSRFMENKAYLVTYQNTDPLFVIDLNNESKPKVLGELKIPGYSTYLHPYDENHLIGIGMETEEVINRNSSGKVTSTTAKIIGMKMALFDVSDVENPIQISQTVIGDRRTTSAILTNPKALLFSKEKQLIAIPVNNYSEDFEIDSNDTYSSIINSYTNYNKQYVAEGYFVYNINIKDGFKLKGIITHEKNNKNNSGYYYDYNNSKLLRGLYIDNNLYTVSENAVKVNDLDSLKMIDELKIK